MSSSRNRLNGDDIQWKQRKRTTQGHTHNRINECLDICAVTAIACRDMHAYTHTHIFIQFSLCFHSTKFVCANIKNSTPNSPTTEPFWVSHKPLSPVLFFILIWHILYLGWTFLRCIFWIEYVDLSPHRPICEMNIFKRMNFRYGNLFIAALICSVYVLDFFFVAATLRIHSFRQNRKQNFAIHWNFFVLSVPFTSF